MKNVQTIQNKRPTLRTTKGGFSIRAVPLKDDNDFDLFRARVGDADLKEIHECYNKPGTAQVGATHKAQNIE